MPRYINQDYGLVIHQVFHKWSHHSTEITSHTINGAQSINFQFASKLHLDLLFFYMRYLTTL
jgi:hypothetical protein